MSLAGVRVLVTGATGFLGSQLARRLLREGARVTVAMRAESDPWRIADLLDRVERVDLDVVDRKSFEQAARRARPEVLFHLAAWTGARHLPADDPEARKAVPLNTQAALNAAVAADRSGARRVVRTGGMAEYAEGPAPFHEESPCSAEGNPYGVSQAAGTFVFHRANLSPSLQRVTLRPSIIYGPAQDSDYFLPGLIRACLADEDFPMTTGEQTVDVVFVDDVVDALLLAAEVEAAAGEIFNVGSGREIAVRELAEVVVRLTGTRGRLLVGAVPSREGEAKRRFLDVAKAGRVLGWGPRTPLEDGLGRTIDWFRRHS